MPDYQPKQVPARSGGFTRPRTSSFQPAPPSRPIGSPAAIQPLLSRVLDDQQKALGSRGKGVRRASLLDSAWQKYQGPLRASFQQAILEGAASLSVNLSPSTVMALAQGQVEGLIDDLDSVTLKRVTAGKDPFSDSDKRIQLAAETRFSAAHHEGMLAAAKSQPGVRKMWSAHPECCDTCKDLDDQEPKSLDSQWETDHGTFTAPPAHPRCRCTLSFTKAARNVG